MSEAINNALKLLISYWPVVLVIGLLQTIIIINVVTAVASIIGIVLALCFEIALYARIVSSVKGEAPPSVPAALKQNAINYLIVLFVLSGPALCLQIFLSAINAFGVEGFIAKNVLMASISCLSIYVFPIVFVKVTNLSAIPVGFAYLLKSFAFSLPLFGFVALRHVLAPLAVVVGINADRNIALIGAVGVATNIISTALMVLVFAAAAYAICGSTGEVLTDDV